MSNARRISRAPTSNRHGRQGHMLAQAVPGTAGTLHEVWVLLIGRWVHSTRVPPSWSPDTPGQYDPDLVQ